MRFSAALALALPAIAAATAIPRDGGNCNTGPIQCCNSVQAANTPTSNNLLGLLGLALGPITGLIGLNCSPLSVLGVGGNSCSAQPVCCTNNQFVGTFSISSRTTVFTSFQQNGLINLGCSPINLNL